MTKVTYYIYSCDTCCMSREGEMDGLDCVKCQKSRKRDMDGIFEMFNENKTKLRKVVFFILETNRAIGWRRCSGLEICDFKERRSSFSLDFRRFGPSILDGVRNKVDLSGEGYAWTPIWWSSDNSKR